VADEVELFKVSRRASEFGFSMTFLALGAKDIHLVFNEKHFISIISTNKDLWYFYDHFSSIHNSPFRSYLRKAYSFSKTNVQTKNHNTLKKTKNFGQQEL